MSQVEAMSNNNRKNNRIVARLISLLWAFFVLVGPPAMYVMWTGGKPPDYVWFAIYQGLAISAVIIPFIRVRLGGIILVVHGVGSIFLSFGYFWHPDPPAKLARRA